MTLPPILVKLEKQLSEYENQPSLLLGNVNITSLLVLHPGLVVYNYSVFSFDVTIQNTGVIDLVGATLVVKMPSDSDNYWIITTQIERLHGGEERTFSLEANSGIDAYLSAMGPSPYIATLTLGDFVLDEFVYVRS